MKQPDTVDTGQAAGLITGSDYHHVAIRNTEPRVTCLPRQSVSRGQQEQQPDGVASGQGCAPPQKDHSYTLSVFSS